MNAKEAKVVREQVIETVSGVDFGMEYVGRTSEGALFRTAEGDHVAIRAIVKAENFDAEGALADFVSAQEKAAAKAAEKAAKVAKAKG